MMKYFKFVATCLVTVIVVLIFSPNNTVSFASQPPPTNPYLVDSPWPMAHGSPYSQASVSLRGPEPTDEIAVDFAEVNGERWPIAPIIAISAQYPTGERTIWGGTFTQVYKALPTDKGIEIVDTFKIDRNPFDVHMYCIMLANNQFVVADGSKILVFADEDPNNPRSPLQKVKSWRVPRRFGRKVSALNLTYDGQIVFGGKMRSPRIGVVDRLFSQSQYMELPIEKGERSRNNISVDRDGGIYVVTNKALYRFQWDGNQLSLLWRTPYDMGDDGSGTTPSLMGVEGEDKLVIVTDGHNPNNIIAFWRDEIPSDWQGLPGQNRRIAAIEPMPYSKPTAEGGVTNENSPVISGYGVAVAQWNGGRIKPKECSPEKGVQKYLWNPQNRKLELAWANGEVNLNNVLVVSEASGLLYGVSKSHGDCQYYFEMLDWQTGAVVKSIAMGEDGKYHNHGNTIAIGDRRRAFWGSSKGIVQIRPLYPSNSVPNS